MLFLLLRQTGQLNTPFGPTKCRTNDDAFQWQETCPSLVRCKKYPLGSPNPVASSVFSQFPARYQLDQSTELSTCVASTDQTGCRVSCWVPCISRLDGELRAELTMKTSGDQSTYESTLTRYYYCPDPMQVGGFMVLPAFVFIVLLIWAVSCCVKRHARDEAYRVSDKKYFSGVSGDKGKKDFQFTGQYT